MGKTVFNPITTKWRGAIGGFRYSVVRGKQVIAERASAVRNPRTKAQMDTRAKFKLASQFSALWAEILNLNLAKIEHDRVLTRARATQVGFDAISFNEYGNAELLLSNFADDMNANTHQPISADLQVTFTAQTQSITAPSGSVVSYKVVAFDEENTPIGSNVSTYTSAGTAKMVDLPAIFGTACRYDILVFLTETLEGAEEFTGKITSMQGSQTESQLYYLYAKAASESMINITGLYPASYLVS